MPDDRDWKVPIGLTAIIERLGLKIPHPVVRSEVVAGSRKTIVTNTQVLEQYPRIYQPPEGMVGQLRFALRYEPLDLRVYKAAFMAMERSDLELWVQNEPNGIFARRAWYLYEMFTGNTLNVPDLESGRYIDLLDEELHITAPATRVKRQRVFDNLLGNKDYCPLIRRTDKLKLDFSKDLAEQARTLVSGVDPGVLKRAVHYMFTKETKSSFAIEGETPSKDRTERFVAALMRAEKFDPVQKHSFIELQNAIVDPRYAQKDWREVQVFIGSISPDYSQEVHFICPKPADVGPLMAGWMRMVDRMLDPESTVHPVCAAAAAAFGFVFVHPFLDGNGRIHRFLVHNVLARRNFTPEGVLFPVSAAMLREMSAYDRVLENFSNSIQPYIQYSMNEEDQVEVANETADLYRFFDATSQTEYLFECIEDAIRRDLRAELDFLKFRDAAVKAVMEIVDMPNQRAALLVRTIHQNNGKLQDEKRQQFAELTDEEIGKMVAAVHNLLHPAPGPGPVAHPEQTEQTENTAQPDSSSDHESTESSHNESDQKAD
ncbi:MAG TPA: Fic family protein [Candidatus Angelobacter sp.]|nr:Fic family protein [Candidatus Angelobacter sp.]